MTDSQPCQRDSGSSPTRKSVPGPVKWIESTSSVVQRLRALADARDVGAPRCDRIVLVQPHRELDRLPESIEIRLAEHLLGPADVRDADHGPVVQLLVDLAVGLLRQLEHPRLADAFARKVAEQVGLGITGERDHRGPFVADLLRAVEQPGRCPGEELLCGAFDHRSADVLVGVVDVYVGRARPVGRTGDRTRNRRMLDAGEHVDELAGLHVRTHANSQLRVPVFTSCARAGHSASCQVSSRMIGTASPSFVRPSTSSSGRPTMKSVCTVEMFMPSPGSPSNVSGIPKP